MQRNKTSVSLIMCCLMASAFTSTAQTSFESSLVKDSMLLDIDVGSSTIVVGERGHVLLADSDNRFSQVTVPTKTTLTGVTSFDNHVWAVGHDATIIHSSDGGVTWNVQLSLPELDRPFLDALFFDDMHGIAVGAYGLFYRTIDGGETWQEELHPSVLPQQDIDYLETIKDEPEFYKEELSFILPHFNRLSMLNGRLVMSGEAGLLAISNDYGKNWKRQEIDYQGSFFDAIELDDATLVAVGLRGHLFVKSTQSNKWEERKTCVTTSLNSIVSDKQGLFVTGNNGVILSIDLDIAVSQSAANQQRSECAIAKGLTLLNTDVSDAILNAAFIDNQLVAVTASGIKQLSVK